MFGNVPNGNRSAACLSMLAVPSVFVPSISVHAKDGAAWVSHHQLALSLEWICRADQDAADDATTLGPNAECIAVILDGDR